jgi:pimeloyl-ACP methyl ester carboxylesterase
MFNERAFINRVEEADIKTFAELLAHPTADEERALRVHFGDERYKRLHARALRRGVRAATTPMLGNVVVIHGIMGGELSTHRGGSRDHVWARVWALLRGKVTQLRLAADGRGDFDPNLQVSATGILKNAYGDTLLALAHRWNVQAFWYDWRKDLTLAAAELSSKIDGWFGHEAPVHIVAHSMGGLVARTFIRDRPERWKTMWDKTSAVKGTAGGRLIMLGTPNHGSFAIPQTITGLEGMVRKLALADLHHDLDELLPVFNSFLGSYQMMPSPFAMDGVKWLYDAAKYGRFGVPQEHLDTALKHHESLRDVIDPERMRYIAGFNQATFSGLTKERPDLADAYRITREGDGRVPHQLGFLKGVPNYFVDDGHGALPENDKVLAATDELLATGDTTALPQTFRITRAIRSQKAERDALLAQQKLEEARFQALAQRAQTRSVDPAANLQISALEREMQENLTSGFLPTTRSPAMTGFAAPEAVVESAQSGRKPGTGRGRARDAGLPPRPVIEIAVVRGDIAATDSYDDRSLPIDAVAVGHYIGVKPQNAEAALDSAISAAMGQSVTGPDGGIIAQYAERGVLVGELGQPFFLADPRARKSVNRVIALAGMGVVGRFGAPELTVLARELCWSLGRMGKRHLATVLIGAGVGNLQTDEAIGAWLRGARRAISGSAQDETNRLRRITFVEHGPGRIKDLQLAILAEAAAMAADLEVRYQPIPAATLQRFEQQGAERVREQWLARHEREEKENPAPTRLTVELDRGTYTLGAVTDEASIPVRKIRIDPQLVAQANDELVGLTDTAQQREQGEYLGKLLIPEDLRRTFTTNAPIVLMMDSTTARIHWEMLAHRDLAAGKSDDADTDARFREFLGTSRGFTRQLRTTFSPPPEPPPPPRRTLRVLVVADPAPDARLAGAEAEGVEVAELFRSFNSVHAGSDSTVEVTTLLGPTEATRNRVMKELVLETYDVLHFAGHCTYDESDPELSGWIFGMEPLQLLTANELSRIDRVPKFIFSNACESGVLRDRPRERNAALAPSFAEAFFARGVANFVCTAWPVDDVAAREFALALYRGLLGLTRSGQVTEEPPEPWHMHKAMREARRLIARRDYGVSTWGAYQHYGNPYLRFFDPATLGGDAQRAAPTARRSAKTKARGKARRSRARGR